MLVNVEAFILSKCDRPDADDYLHSDFIDAVDGGGWQGWHCEGSYIRSMFGLLFYDIIFCENACDNVFLTPFQDSPLDMGYPSFYSTR